MNLVYYPASDGGFVGSEDGQTQVCDFREGMGEKHGDLFAAAPALLSMLEKTVALLDAEDGKGIGTEATFPGIHALIERLK